nr:hypothetical protein [bacterium]
MSRKDRLKRNLGGTVEEEYLADPFFKGPILTAARVSVVMVERIILQILRTEVTRLSTTPSELTRYFHHIYDPTISEDERKAFEANFTAAPPTTVLGYPRTTTDLPCFAVVLESDEESDSVLGKYVGETLEGEVASEDAMYEGAVFDQTYGIYVYAQHPDVCAYLYQFCKLVLFGAREALEAAGV